MATAATDSIIRLTGKQKVALMLRKSGLSDTQVGQKLGISRTCANSLIARGRRAQAELRKAVREFIDAA